MKFEIQQEDFQKVLDIVASVVPAKTTLPILTCILLEAQKDQLKLTATNLDISVTTTTDKIIIKKEGRVALPAAKFVSFVRSLRPGEINMALVGKQIRLDAGKARLTENTMNVDEFPALKELPAKEGLPLSGNTLISMINETSYAVSRDETRPALMGILWEIRSDSLTLVATDAHRLARSQRNPGWDINKDREMIADTGGLRHLPRIVAAMQEEDDSITDVSVFMGENQLSFRAGSTVLHTRLLEGPFPDYRAVIPQDNDKEIVVDRHEFIQAIRRVSITADRSTNQVRLGIEKGRMELMAQGAEGSQSEDEIPVSYDGPALEMGFNFSYLQDVLKNIQSDSVVMSLKDAQSASLIRPLDEESEESPLLCLLMPLRLAGD